MFQTWSTLLYLAPQAELTREYWPCTQLEARDGTGWGLRVLRLRSRVLRVAFQYRLCFILIFPKRHSIYSFHFILQKKQLRFGDILLLLRYTCFPVESEWLFVPNSITPPALYFNMTKLGAWSNTVDYIEVRQVGYQGLTGQQVKTFGCNKTAKIITTWPFAIFRTRKRLWTG